MSVTYVNTISAQDYVELRALTNWPPYSVRQMQIGLEKTDYVIAAMDGEKAVGAARLICDGASYGIIGDVIVRPEYRGCGIGQHMINSIIEYVKSRLEPGESFGLTLMAAQNRESFYEQMGFRNRPDDSHGHGMAMRIFA